MVTVDSFGGMMPESSQTQCDEHECVHIDRKGAASSTAHRPVTAAQIDALYAVVHDQAFDRIRKETHGVIYDAGGVNITVRAAGNTYCVGPSATESVARADEPRFQAVLDAVGGLWQSLPASAAPRDGGAE
jgi:hypothetical protein